MTKSEKVRRENDWFWSHGKTLSIHEEPDTTPLVYDLEERTARFREAIIDFAKKIPRGPLTDRIIDQLTSRSRNQRRREIISRRMIQFLKRNS